MSRIKIVVPIMGTSYDKEFDMYYRIEKHNITTFMKEILNSELTQIAKELKLVFEDHGIQKTDGDGEVYRSHTIAVMCNSKIVMIAFVRVYEDEQ